jgi:hypothetical protein
MKKSNFCLITVGLLLLAFLAVAPVSAAGITVKSPNGGETWQRGTAHTVTWSYTDFPAGAPVKIILVKAGADVGTIVTSTSIGAGGTGSFTWDIGSSPSLSTGTNFKVKVQSINQPTVFGTSNSYFTLNPAGSAVPSGVVTRSGQNVPDNTAVDLPTGFTLGQCAVMVSPYQFYCPQNTFLSEFYSFYSSGGSDTRFFVRAIGYCTTLNSNAKQTAMGRSNYLIICHS